MQAPIKDPNHRSKERSAIVGVVASLWLVVIALSLYGAPAVRDAVTKNDTLAENAALIGAVDAVIALSDAVGLSAVRGVLGRARAAINAPYTTLEPADEPPVDPAPAPVVTPDAGQVADDVLVHHAAPAKKRILVVGASSIQFAIGTELERRLPTYDGVSVRRFGQLATGLSRPDFFDWPKKIDTLSKRFKPDLIIANFGGNGAQPIHPGTADEARFKTEAWDVEYGKKVQEVVDVANKHRADIAFLGMPNMRKERFAAKMRYLNRVQEAAAQSAGALWIDTWAMSSTPDGKYRKSIQLGKKRGLMRTSDGVHYRKLGARFVIDNVMQILERHFVLGPPDLSLAVAHPHAFESRLLDRRIEYLAYVPRGRADAPLLYVLPGAPSTWSTWPNHPHRQLQRLAQAHGLLIVVPDMAAIGWYVDGPGAPYARHFVDELMVDVRAHVAAGPVTGVAGLGTGGHAAMALALAEPQRFASASATDGLMDLTEARGDATLAPRLGDDPQAWLQASPVALAAALEGAAPALRLAGTATDLAAALTAAGVTAEQPPGPEPWPKGLDAVIAWHAAKLSVPLPE